MGSVSGNKRNYILALIASAYCYNLIVSMCRYERGPGGGGGDRRPEAAVRHLGEHGERRLAHGEHGQGGTYPGEIRCDVIYNGTSTQFSSVRRSV